MTKRELSGLSKSDAVRTVVAENPGWTSGEVAEFLGTKGIEITAAHASTVMSKDKAKAAAGGEAPKPKKPKSDKPAKTEPQTIDNGEEFSLADLAEVVRQCGGLDGIKGMLEDLESYQVG